MENVVRTVYGAFLQTTQLLNLPFEQIAHTTLNEKFNIDNNFVLPAGDMPFLQYVGIGNGGHQMVIGANNIAVPQPIQHSPTDAALYNQLPFVLRLPSNDLTPAQMAGYRLRTLVTYGGVQYIAYYLKVLNLANTAAGITSDVPSMLYNTVSNGSVTSTGFVPSASNLNPTPPSINTSGVVSTTGDYVAATAKVPFTMSLFDISEFLNVANIIYGDPSYAIISEIALCSGIDSAVTGTFNGISQNYTEAMVVQVMTFISSFYAAQFTNSGINLLMDVGAVEPLFALQ